MNSPTLTEEQAQANRWHASECNNRAWELAELAARTPEQDSEMLNAAHAAAFHWRQAGTALHVARAQMLLAHVHAQLGHGQLALRYAERSHVFLLDNNSPDWERAFSHAILAQAALAAGEN